MSRPVRRVAPYLAPVSDRRTIAPVPWELLLDGRLSPFDKALAAVLWGHMTPEGVARPSQGTLATILGRDERTVKRGVRRLRDTGWLEVELRSRGAEKKPSLYRARHPVHGPMKRPKVPQQMELALLQLQRGPVLVRGTPVSPAGDTSVPSAGDTSVPQTKALKEEHSARGGGGSEMPPPAAESGWEKGGPKYREMMARLKEANVPFRRDRTAGNP